MRFSLVHLAGLFPEQSLVLMADVVPGLNAQQGVLRCQRVGIAESTVWAAVCTAAALPAACTAAERRKPLDTVTLGARTVPTRTLQRYTALYLCGINADSLHCLPAHPLVPLSLFLTTCRSDYKEGERKKLAGLIHAAANNQNGHRFYPKMQVLDLQVNILVTSTLVTWMHRMQRVQRLLSMQLL
jgi:hypothetical protein